MTMPHTAALQDAGLAVLGFAVLCLFALLALPLFCCRAARRESRLELEGEDAVSSRQLPPPPRRRSGPACDTCHDWRCVCRARFCPRGYRVAS